MDVKCGKPTVQVVYGKPNGLNWLTASFFLVADMAGGGIVALPVAMVQSGKTHLY